ncbi:MAG: leucine--tRNA ligase, partial [Candidatus Bathyarchaeia archaeon]
MSTLDWRAIETKWQRKWAEKKIYEANADPSRPKCFVTFPYPYMSGPLHVGHGYSASRCDVFVRYKKMKGVNVLWPWAWHWTGETVAGASERIKLGDKAFIKALIEIDHVPPDELKKFVEPVYMAKYYTDYNREAVKQLGLAIDWRREFHTTSYYPTYSKFIEWQYMKLKQRGYVVQGTHPVVWCPKCESPTGEHDRLQGGGVSPEEYVLVKYIFGDAFLPAATLRPETIYGVTNIWLNPSGDYVEADVDGEKWIISKVAAEKLKEQLYGVKVLREFKGETLIGKTCKEPINLKEILILPGWFVDPFNATGVVYSVPAHAPYDWLALKDLIDNPELFGKFNIDPEQVKNIKPISVISIEEFGEFPALEIVEKMQIKSQKDLEKADEATKIIYKKEFHKGILREICGEYAGKNVAQVKRQLIEDFKKKGIMDTMYELPQEVVCRCTTKCVVKVLKDQWFLNYSDPEWKAKTLDALNRMEVYPKEAKKWFEDVINWLHEWACARKTGLGTPLPWSPTWIVETLSDSTIYMAFYTINNLLKQYKITAEQLTEEFFDYIFYGIGDLVQLANNSKLDQDIIQSIRREFLYWYPVDLRNSGKDLVANHLTFYLFHHTALFPPEHWPKAISVNGFMRVEGEEMHKSKGNFIPLRKAVEEFGADITRCMLLLAAEGMDDPDWRAASLAEVKTNLNSFYKFILDLRRLGENIEINHLERWLISVTQRNCKKISESIEMLKTRTALEVALYEIWNDFRWYLRRADRIHKETVQRLTEMWVKLLAPFIPHVCEEIWSQFGYAGFIAESDWPIFNEKEIYVADEEAEELIKKLFYDTKNILKVTGIEPKKIYYYTAAEWKWHIYMKILEKSANGSLSKDLIREFMKQP